MEENMKENIEEVKELEELMGKIAEAMQQSRNKQAAIEAKDYELHNETRPMVVDEGKVQLEDMKKDKEEFDEMTINALKRTQERVMGLKEKTEQEYNQRLEKSVNRTNEIRRKLEGIKAHFEDPETITRAEESANRAIQKEEESMSAYQARHEDMRGTLDNAENDLRNYAIELDALDEVQGITTQGKDPTKEEMDENIIDENEINESEIKNDEINENEISNNKIEENTIDENEVNENNDDNRRKAEENETKNKTWLETEKEKAKKSLEELEQSVSYLELSGIEDKETIEQRDAAKKRVELLEHKEYASLSEELENIERMSAFYGGEIEESLADRKVEIEERLKLLENDDVRALEEELENVERWVVHYQDDPEAAKPFKEQAEEIRQKLDKVIETIKDPSKEQSPNEKSNHPIEDIFKSHREDNTVRMDADQLKSALEMYNEALEKGDTVGAQAMAVNINESLSKEGLQWHDEKVENPEQQPEELQNQPEIEPQNQSQPEPQPQPQPEPEPQPQTQETALKKPSIFRRWMNKIRDFFKGYDMKDYYNPKEEEQVKDPQQRDELAEKLDEISKDDSLSQDVKESKIEQAHEEKGKNNDNQEKKNEFVERLKIIKADKSMTVEEKAMAEKEVYRDISNGKMFSNMDSKEKTTDEDEGR